MLKRLQIGWIACLVALVSTAGVFAQEIDTDFSSNPTFEGWSTTAGHQFQEKNTWTAPGDGRPGFITVRKGRWLSPSFPVKPFHYYKLTIESRLNVEATGEKEKKSDLKGGMWALFCYDRQVNQHPANLYSLIYPSTDWRKQQFVFMAEEGSAGAQLHFQPKSDVPLSIRRVTVEPVSEKEALAWSEAVYESLPELTFRPPENRHEHLADTIRKLENGEDVTIVTLGDSIANDMTNGSTSLLLERAYPDANVTWITSVGGGKGAWHFRRGNRVQEKIIRHDPDLLVMGGASHWGQVKPFRDVLRKVRKKSDTDVLVLTGVITPPDGMVDWINKIQYLNRSEARDAFTSFPDRLKTMAAEEEVEFFNIRGAWEAYIDGTDRPREWFMRDGIHGNTRGKQIAGRMLIRYLSPRE